MAVRQDPGTYSAPGTPSRRRRTPAPAPVASVTSIAPPTAPAPEPAPTRTTTTTLASATAAPSRAPAPTTTLASTTTAPSLPQQLLQAKLLGTTDDPEDLPTQLRAAATAATPMRRLDRAFAPGETISPRNAALLAEAEGLPGKTYAEIAKGESDLRPNVVGYDPGGTHGLGLWQMTPGVQSPETRQQWTQIARQHPGGYQNPVASAEMAAVLAGEGTGVENYYGTGYVTDPNAHVPGGPTRARTLLRRSPPYY